MKASEREKVFHRHWNTNERRDKQRQNINDVDATSEITQLLKLFDEPGLMFADIFTFHFVGEIVHEKGKRENKSEKSKIHIIFSWGK